MTLQASSSRRISEKRVHPALHAFWQGAREGAVVTALSFLVYLGMFAGSVLYMLYNMRQMNINVLERTQYYLFSPQTSYYLPAVFLAAAMIQGFLTFRFLYRKSAANAWLSLGLTRARLFWSRFLAGATGMLLPILLSMLVVLAINLAVFHEAGLLLTRWLQMTAGLLAQAAALYCIAAAVCASVGSAAEALGYTFIAACLPSALLMGVNALMVQFLFGCGDGAPEYMYSSFTPVLVTDCSGFNPLLFLYKYILRYAADDGKVLTQVSALPILGWLAAAAAIAYLACRRFKARRVETAGVMGCSRALGFSVIFAVAFFAFSAPYMLPADLLNRVPEFFQLIISAALAAAVFCLLAFPLRLVGRQAWKGLLALPVELAVMFAVVVALAAGGFGYTSFVPDTANVKSVSVSYNGIAAYVDKDGWGGGGGLVRSLEFDSTINLTDPGDIAAAASLHRAYADTGRLAPNMGTVDPAQKVYRIPFRIQYTLKDGRTVRRLFMASNRDLAMKLTSIDGLAGARAAFRSHFTVNADDIHSYRKVPQAGVYLSSRFLDRTVPLSLDDGQMKELLACVAEDVAAQSVEDRYFPAKPEICALDFAEEHASVQNGLPDWSERIYVTESFARTVDFLNRNNLLAAVSGAADVDYVEVQNYFINKDYLNSEHNGHNQTIFLNGLGNVEQLDREKGLLKISDAGQFASILQNSRSQYLALDGGYVVFIHHKGKEFLTSAFLPMKDAPDFVKQGAK